VAEVRRSTRKIKELVVPTLCVIDMQPKFTSSKWCLEAVLKQVEYSKANKEGIVIVEYDGYGPTHRAITEALKAYPLSDIVVKENDNGANEFLTTAEKSGFSLDVVIAVGVNRGYCVFDTVKGIIENGTPVQLIESATWSAHDPRAELDSLMSLALENNKLEIL
jgi:nicotinamidase-related amidase